MRYPRYRVATCEGYTITGNTTARRGGAREPGLSATVCDSLHLWREVKTYRSEDQVFRNGRREARGRTGALRDAHDHAAWLNAAHGRALHAARVRELRAKAQADG